MKKVSLLILVTMILLLAFTSCDVLPEPVVGVLDTVTGTFENVKDTVLGVLGIETHEHVWTDATCESPKTCECGETEGEALGHTWVDATCDAPKTCSVCKATEGEPNADAHVWVDATCSAPKHCEVCGLEEGRKLNHDYADATCSAPRTCKACGETVGSPKSHAWVDASCTAPKTCSACGKTEGSVLEHNWVDATCDAPKTCSGCNATEGEALGHDWKDASCAAPKTCNKCGATEGEALEHSYTFEIIEKTCEVDGSITYTCTVCGDSYRENVVPATGHEFGAVSSCDEAAVCTICGYTDPAAGHDWAEANCQAPKTCKRCGATEGIPADHIYTEATCTDPAVCTICDFESDIYAAHRLDQKCDYEKDATGKVTAEHVMYWCTICEMEFPITNGDYLDGSDYNGMTPVENANRGYIVQSGTHLPIIATDETGNKYYELIIKKTLDWSLENNTPGQLQLWVPNSTGGNGLFNANNYATGFFSFRFNSSMDCKELPLRMRFVDNSLGDTDPITGENIRWTDKWCIDGEFFTVNMKHDEGYAEIVGWGHVLTTIPLNEDGWTGWVDMKMGVQFDPDVPNSKGSNGIITVHYYMNGEYLDSVSMPLCTLTFGISSVYITGTTITEGHGLMLDDIQFGCNTDMQGAWPYDVHTCKFTITDCTVPAVCEICGAESEVGEHPWINATCTTPKYCPICNTIEGEALGHDLGGATCDQPASCSRPGCEFTSGDQPLGHDMAPATCLDPATCTRCGATEGEALGHDMAPATCLDPAKCNRCGITEGDPRGHVFADATCTAPKTCECGETEGEALGHIGGTAGCSTRAICDRCSLPYGNTAGHTLTYAYADGKVTYTCSVCAAAFTTDKNFWFDGSTDDLQGNGTANTDRGFTATADGKPVIVTEGDNSYYQLLKADDASAQYQIFVPHGSTFSDFADFSCANNAIGFVAFSINAKVTTNLSLKIVDGRGTAVWDWGTCAKDIFYLTPADANGVVTLKGYGEKVIGTVTVGEDKFTGWVDVVISIQLNSDETMTLNYYIGGKNVGQMSVNMPITTQKIGALYFSGTTAGTGTGMKIDNLAFGFSTDKKWTLGTCDHQWTEADCTHPSQCSECGEIQAPALGHVGGEATCTTKAVCTRCEKEYGDFGHVADPATCAAASVCTLCNVVVAPKLPHAELSWSYADGKATYVCADCNTSYVLDKNWHFDGTGENPYQNMVSVDENNIYNTITKTETKDGEEVVVDTGNPVIVDGVYTYINDGGAPEAGKQGKATIWIPCMNGGIDNFEDFSCENNAIGFYSFSINAYCDTLFQMQLVDTDMRVAANRPEGTDFWNHGALPYFFEISAPDANNLVTVKGWDGLVLKKVNVGADKFTGWFDVTVSIELSSEGTVTLGYYIDGEYVGSVSRLMNVVTGKLDGVYFQIKAHTVGGGVMWDDVCFGYVSPEAE